MKILDEIFDSHEKLVALNKGTLEFGFSWKKEDGIVLVNPDNNIVMEYLPYVVNEICGADLSVTCTLKDLIIALEKFPNALLVLGATPTYQNKKMHHYYNELYKILPSNFINRVISIRELGEFLPIGDNKTKFIDMYRKTYLATSKKNKEKVYKAFELFEDSLSQATFIAVLKRYLLHSNTIIPVSEQAQYFEDVYTPSKEEVFIDLGGFIGDTLQIYVNQIGNNFSEYHVLEPEPTNFEKLQTTIASFSQEIQEKVTAYPVGAGHVYSDSKITQSTSGSRIIDTVSEINATETVSIKITPLDDLLQDIAPTLIKLDIEGYEAFALAGARNIIREHRPVVACSVYHHSFDLWELPLMIHKFVPNGYRYFLRAYTDIWEYVCYCVPEERVSEVWK